MRSKNETGDAVMRQWAILRHIPQYPRTIAATEIRKRLESEGFMISLRTIERHLIALSDRFPLMCDESVRPYGWSWMKDSPTTSFPGLSPIQALTFSLARDHLAHFLPKTLMQSISQYFKNAEEVLLGDFNIKNIKEWRGKVANAPAYQPLLLPTYSQEVVEAIHDALFTESQVEITYVSRTKDNQTQKYTIHPLGLIQRGSVMYLVARLFNYDDVRILALHRVKTVRKLEEKVKKPAGYTLKNYLETGALGYLSGKEIKLVVRFTKEACAHLRETPLSKDQKMVEEKSGLIRVEATVQNTDQLFFWLMGFGGNAEILKPKALRDEMIRVVKAMSDVYK